MTMQNASAADSCPEQAQPAPSYDDLFTDANLVGVLDYLRLYQTIPLTTLDIDRFIERTITNPAHPRAWNAGYLAGWLAGLTSWSRSKGRVSPTSSTTPGAGSPLRTRPASRQEGAGNERDDCEL